MLPQLDRLDDDATQQSLRDVKPWELTYFPGPVGNMLFNSYLYNPQLYAIRRLEDTKPDTLSDIEVVQLDIGSACKPSAVTRARNIRSTGWFWICRHPFSPGKPRQFGHELGFLEYYGAGLGDRNGLTSAGWIDPFAFGTHYWNMSGYFSRPDGTNVNISYRQLDPSGVKSCRDRSAIASVQNIGSLTRHRTTSASTRTNSEPFRGPHRDRFDV